MKSQSKSKNHFFIIGAQRSGSTILYNLLDSHPDIAMNQPLFPESKYFIKNNSIDKQKFYDQHFDHVTSELILGEKSTSYCDYPDALQRIYDFDNNAKIIYIMRNPVERALSNYFYSVKNKIEPRTPREVFLDKEKAPLLDFKPSVDPFDYYGRGIYINYIKILKKIFPPKNVHFLQYEALVDKDSAGQIQKLLEFLNTYEAIDSTILFKKVNLAERDLAVDNQVIESLYSFFQTHNQLLEPVSNFDLSLWQS